MAGRRLAATVAPADALTLAEAVFNTKVRAQPRKARQARERKPKPLTKAQIEAKRRRYEAMLLAAQTADEAERQRILDTIPPVGETTKTIDDLLESIGDAPAPWQGAAPESAAGKRRRWERDAAVVDESPLAQAGFGPNDRELVIDRTGKPRQAGGNPAYGAESPWVVQKRTLAEQSLYYFTKFIMGRKYLSYDCHKPVCDWLQTVPPHRMTEVPPRAHAPGRRKGLLMPREHCKSTIVAHSLPIHIQIQPRASNVYFHDEAGEDQRIILMCETEKMGKDRLRVVQTALEANPKIRAFWPHRVWKNPRRESKKWNDVELILPRRSEYPDPSIRCVGVGGAITGAHPSVLIKDDLISFDAMNSPLIMQEAIDYHKTSRALIGRPTCLEFIIGTRWAVYDLYSEIMDNDPTVSWWVRSMVEDGQAIYPEFFPLERIPDLQAEHDVMFPLFYMNEAADPKLVDFDMKLVRKFLIETGDDGVPMLVFDEDERDAMLAERQGAHAPAGTNLSGVELNADSYNILRERAVHLRQMRVAA